MFLARFQALLRAHRSMVQIETTGCRRSGCAHNLCKEVFQENCHALEKVVDLRSLLKMWPPVEKPG